MVFLPNSYFAEEGMETQSWEGFVTQSISRETCLGSMSRLIVQSVFCLRLLPGVASWAQVTCVYVPDASDCSVFICLPEVKLVALSGFLGARVPVLLARTAGAMWLPLLESQAFYLCQITCPA